MAILNKIELFFNMDIPEFLSNERYFYERMRLDLKIRGDMKTNLDEIIRILSDVRIKWEDMEYGYMYELHAI